MPPRLAPRAFRPRTRPVIVKGRIVKHAEIRPASLKEDLDYIERDVYRRMAAPVASRRQG
jgi:hypothetical protein